MLNSKHNATKFKQTGKKNFFGPKHFGATTVKVDIFLFNSALASLLGVVAPGALGINFFRGKANANSAANAALDGTIQGGMLGNKPFQKEGKPKLVIPLPIAPMVTVTAKRGN